MIAAQDAHIRTAPPSTLDDHLSRPVENAHKHGPEASPLVVETRSFLGRSREKLKPVPPPLWWILAMLFKASKMPSMESSTGMTKQAEAGLKKFRHS